jgi:hypothetical protein
MDEREREPFPREDPREGAASDQNTELNPSETAPREDDDPGDSGAKPDAPGTSSEKEGGPGQATGNPDTAG